MSMLFRIGILSLTLLFTSCALKPRPEAPADPIQARGTKISTLRLTDQVTEALESFGLKRPWENCFMVVAPPEIKNSRLLEISQGPCPEGKKLADNPLVTYQISDPIDEFEDDYEIAYLTDRKTQLEVGYLNFKGADSYELQELFINPKDMSRLPTIYPQISKEGKLVGITSIYRSSQQYFSSMLIRANGITGIPNFANTPQLQEEVKKLLAQLKDGAGKLDKNSEPYKELEKRIKELEDKLEILSKNIK